MQSRDFASPYEQSEPRLFGTRSQWTQTQTRGQLAVDLLTFLTTGRGKCVSGKQLISQHKAHGSVPNSNTKIWVKLKVKCENLCYWVIACMSEVTWPETQNCGPGVMQVSVWGWQWYSTLSLGSTALFCVSNSTIRRVLGQFSIF